MTGNSPPHVRFGYDLATIRHRQLPVLASWHVTVLVIEAGGSALSNAVSSNAAAYGEYPGPIMSNPHTFSGMGVAAVAQANSLNWGYRTIPQKYARNETQGIPAGRGIGGSSLVNGMVYSRADSPQIDSWEEAGNTGWNWASLLSYYKKSEHFQNPGTVQIAGGVAYESAVHGFQGPLSTGYTTAMTATANQFPGALNTSYQASGVPFNDDMNGGDMRGFSVIPQTLNTTSGKDVRADSGRSYYYPFTSRTNLNLVDNTRAHKIIWASQNDATGNAVASAVEVTASDGTTQTYQASKEVIVSCGSYASPAFLERSGVGNPKILSSFGIDTKVDLPGVGENLMDQVSSNLTHNLTKSIGFQLGTYATYLNVTDVFGANASDFTTSISNALPGYASAIAAQNNNSTSSEDLLTLLRLQYDDIFQDKIPLLEILHHASGQVLTSEFWGTLPFARGNVHISSADNSALPNINLNYWMFEYDAATMIAAARYLRKLFQEQALQDATIEELHPGLSAIPDDADDQTWETYLKGAYHTAYHGLGSAIMLPKEMGGVVSNHTLVYGTANVRVVDASIIPFQTNGHTQATVYSLAEKASDIIKQDGKLV
ncbi:hypothetical protein FH972_021328 [Carpinus fangiana]|uniref:Glucose-methanol-choline oxidoreductase N-terminal domain-containing protein n=1 Tax=Carpinus fangiana TaxID=176857 RepID=A0A5N6KP86_9ROSI|nr:hypothetical protein FH972_021328 [Carpinus fangiana]